MKFENLGKMMVTASMANVIESSEQFNNFISGCLARYLKEDWGDLDQEDKDTNDEAVKDGERILAAYNIPENIELEEDCDRKIWIITEWDRSVTTILFPSEY